MPVFSRLIVLIGFLISLPASAEFSDQAEIPEYATEAIETLVDLEIFSGNADGSFAPNRQINRAEFCKLLLLATGETPLTSNLQSFPDVPKSAWFFGPVETAKRAGWIKGYEDGSFRPGQSINRAEVAKVLSEAFVLETPEPQAEEAWYWEYEQALEQIGAGPHPIINDTSTDGFPTRAEIAEQIYSILHYLEGIADETEIEEIEVVEEDQIVESTEPAKTSKVEFEYEDTEALKQVIEADAGKLHISKGSNLERRYYAVTNKKTPLLSLDMYSTEGEVWLDTMQIKLSGMAPVENFSRVWIERNGVVISEKVKPDDILVTIPLLKRNWVSTTKQNYIFMADIDSRYEAGKSGRFVLYLPTWLASNTDRKIGFFPFGGSDVIFE